MRTIHVVIVLVVLLGSVLGSAIYWSKTANSFFMSGSGQSSATFTVNIDSDTQWKGTIGGSLTQSGSGSASFTFNGASASACLQKQTDAGYLTVTILKNGTVVASQTTDVAFGVVAVTS